MNEFQVYLAEDSDGLNERLLGSVDATAFQYLIPNAPRQDFSLHPHLSDVHQRVPHSWPIHILQLPSSWWFGARRFGSAFCENLARHPQAGLKGHCLRLPCSPCFAGKQKTRLHVWRSKHFYPYPYILMKPKVECFDRSICFQS